MKPTIQLTLKRKLRPRLLAVWLVLAGGLGLPSAAVLAAPASLTAGEARHLLIRTGFAPTQAEVDQIVGRDAAQVVDALLAQARAAQPVNPPPAFVTAPAPPSLASLKTREEQQAARQQQFREGFAAGIGCRCIQSGAQSSNTSNDSDQVAICRYDWSHCAKAFVKEFKGLARIKSVRHGR